ncbi:MAG TPA: hypothetical protein VN629_12950, partial [Castellaniella sp.]|nr:hypothetical protein [Castellaniella sp.]
GFQDGDAFVLAGGGNLEVLDLAPLISTNDVGECAAYVNRYAQHKVDPVFVAFVRRPSRLPVLFGAR